MKNKQINAFVFKVDSENNNWSQSCQLTWQRLLCCQIIYLYPLNWQ